MIMNVPGGQSYPGYFPSVPPKPPDIASFSQLNVKGEYIEDCDDIKEENDERRTPGPVSPAPFLPSQYSFSRGLPTFNSYNSLPRMPPLSLQSSSLPPMGPGGFPKEAFPSSLPPGQSKGMPPLQPISSMATSLTPLQLIQKLSNYASNNRKRTATMQMDDTSVTTSNLQPPIFKTPRIDKVMSLQQPSPPKKFPQSSSVSPNSKHAETNNNDNDDPEVPELSQPNKSMIDCPVCGDIAVAHFHYGGMCCYSCKAFFRRVVNTNKATKYKCRAGNNQCDVSLANRRSCQACRYKKCVGAGMKPGLVLSDDQCHKKFGPKKGTNADKSLKTSGKNELTEEDVDDPEDASKEQDEMADEDYSVLIDPSKSLSEQNKIGRGLFVSIFTTGSVSSGIINEEELEIFKTIDNNNASASSYLIERQVQNSRKFLSFFHNQRNVFLQNGQINLNDIIQTLVEQAVLMLKTNPDFKTLSTKDQTELLESNTMVVSLITSLEMYNYHQHTMAWNLTEEDHQALRKLNIKTSFNGRAVFGMSDVQSRMEPDLQDDVVKLFKFFDYFSQIGVPRQALFVLSMAVVFNHDCCDIEDRVKVEDMRRRYLIILYECLTHSEGVLGACKIALKLHTAIHHLNRICQLFAQKFVTVKE